MRWSKRRPTIGRLSVDCRSTVGRLSVDRRSTVGILSLNVYLGEEVFLLYCEINLSQMQFYFPLIINSNSRRKGAFFFLFRVTTSQLSGILHSQALLINFYSL